LPKKPRVPPVVRPGMRRPSTRWTGERRNDLLLMGLGVAVVLAVGFIAVFGYYQTQIRPKGETVLKVGERSFSLRYMEQRLRYDIRNGSAMYSSDPAGAPDRLVEEVEVEELMRQGAPEKGVDLSDEAIDAEIRAQENVSANADRNTFAAAYREAVRSSGLSTNAYRDVIAAGVAQTALQAMFQAQAPKTAEQVRFRVIMVGTEDEAKAALDRLRNGEDFAVVAQQVSQHAASRDNGGEMDWLPRGVLEPALDDALFSLDIGQISDIITGQNALFIVQVEERQADRETTPDQQSLLANTAMQNWLSDLKDRLGVAITLDNDKRSDILSVLQSETSGGQ
jgi:peptidyl-prolyl cis-trans isomerase C